MNERYTVSITITGSAEIDASSELEAREIAEDNALEYIKYSCDVETEIEDVRDTPRVIGRVSDV